MNFERMEEQLLLHEGLRLKAYLDTEDNWTLGVGYNITGRTIEFFAKTIGRKFSGPVSSYRCTRAEARKVLRADIERIHNVIPVHFPEYTSLSEIRQRVILDLVFNMGFRVQSFVNTRKAIERHDWTAAVRGLYASKWARQVGDGEGKKFDRADRLTRMLLTDQDYVT